MRNFIKIIISLEVVSSFHKWIKNMMGIFVSNSNIWPNLILILPRIKKK